MTSDELAALSDEDRQALNQHRRMDDSLQGAFKALAAKAPAPLYSDDEFSKMLLNRLEAEGAPSVSRDPAGAGILESMKSFFSPGVPLYAGSAMAAAAALILAVIFYNPVGEISQTASKETNEAEESAAPQNDPTSDGPEMMAEADDSNKDSGAESKPVPGNQVAVAPNPETRQRNYTQPGPVADQATTRQNTAGQNSKENAKPNTDPDQGDASNQELASNMPEAETAPPVEGNEELSEEVRKGFMNDRYAAAFNKEMRLKRAVKNAKTIEEKRQALEDLKHYYDGKGEDEKAADVRRQLNELD